MKEIKFRQWLGERFHYWGFLGEQTPGPAQVGGNYPDSQQFTGCKDKRDIEIFEGDILLVNEKKKFHVVFEPPSFYAVSGDLVLRNKDWRESEVIGNNFQTPEFHAMRKAEITSSERFKPLA